jgi:hypothetical protein
MSAIKDLPVILAGHRLSVVELPCPKTREDGSLITGRDGATQFVVALFMKLRPQPGQRAPKGEEVRVTLETDPGEGFEEGMRVELINPRVSAYQLRTEDGRELAGVSLKATGMVPAGAGVDMNALVTRHAGGGEK